MVETISLEPIDHSWVLGDRSDPRASTKTTFVHSMNPLTFRLIPFVRDTLNVRDEINGVRHLVPSRYDNDSLLVTVTHHLL